jgi:hypothetical protein
MRACYHLYETTIFAHFVYKYFAHPAITSP